MTLSELYTRIVDCIEEAAANGDHPDDQHATIMLPELIEWRDVLRRYPVMDGKG